ncbi:Serine/threonine-protein kinase MARK1 [Myotis davidii]|uniref:non-specific serine/threonine protein kinase n=1 Tax=Myotis davidii TaxID=225400 RepID=L5M5V1_MYODS|nr:Serine/threonine-protein kinase MARK1 [Myotis davidii]
MSSDWATSSSEVSTPPVNQVRFLGDYVLQRTISKGAGATVSLARHVPTATNVVIKAISWKGCPEFPQEVHCLQTLNHPNITSLFEVIATQDKVYLVMEHIRGGDLLEHLETYGRMTEREARAAFRQLVSALQYCHHKGIAHRDVKPANILLEENNIKLADFGFARETKGQNLSTFCGTIYYLAPEIFKQQDYDGCKADVWSLGVTLYKMVTGKLPFKGANIVRQREKILAGKFEVPHFLSRQGKTDPIEVRTATPNPVLKCGSEGSHALHSSRSSSTISSQGTPGGAAHEVGLHTGQAEETKDLDCPGSNAKTPPGSLVETISTTPPADPPEVRTATPSPVLKRGPGRSSTMRNKSHRNTISRGRARGGAAHERGLHTGQAEEETEDTDCPGPITTTPPITSPEFRTDTRSPVLSTIIRGGAKGGAAHESGLHNGQGDGGSPLSPSGHSQGRPGQGDQWSPDAVQEKATQRSPDTVQEKAIQLYSDAVQEVTQRSPDAVQRRRPSGARRCSREGNPEVP